MIRILCIGNRYAEPDSLGARVYELLARTELPSDMQIIDGGLAGLNLLSLMDGCKRIVFVDTILGGDPIGVQILHAEEVESEAVYGHGSGLGYLLGARRALGDGRDQAVYIVGATATESASAVAEAVLAVARGEEICQ